MRKPECKTCKCMIVVDNKRVCDDGLDKYSVINPLFSIFYTYPKAGICPKYEKKEDEND